MNVRTAVAFLCLVAMPEAESRAQSKPLVEFANQRPYSLFAFDLLEASPLVSGGPVEWDFIGSVGKQYNRLGIKSDGVLSTTTSHVETEMQALYSRLIAPFWELQAGVRFDVAYDGYETTTRWHVVLGLEGLAPYWFELEPVVFVSNRGDVSASLTATYDLLVTQRAVLQPRLDVGAAVQDVVEWGVGAGLGTIGVGARLRYELGREFAPYVGVNWDRLVGDTAEMARALGAESGAASLVFGIRIWR